MEKRETSDWEITILDLKPFNKPGKLIAQLRTLGEITNTK